MRFFDLQSAIETVSAISQVKNTRQITGQNKPLAIEVLQVTVDAAEIHERVRNFKIVGTVMPFLQIARHTTRSRRTPVVTFILSALSSRSLCLFVSFKLPYLHHHRHRTEHIAAPLQQDSRQTQVCKRLCQLKMIGTKLQAK
jgi:hypothetical protein